MAARQRLTMLSRIRAARLLLLGLLLVGAVAHAQILNSERIAETFGSYGIDVVATSEDLRVSNLYSIENGQRVTRTYAVVAIPTSVNGAIASVHTAILAGESIGATFKAAGWDVTKRHLYFGRARVPPAVADAMGIERATRVAMHAYVLDVSRDDRRLEYATIVELHHPAYLQLGELVEIYAPDWHAGTDAPDSVGRMLLRAEQLLAARPSALRE
jgi:hypothetical protein